VPVVDVVDRVRDTAVLGLGHVVVVGRAVGGDGHVLEEGVGGDGLVNVRLVLLAQVDGLGVAPALEVEDAVVVPPVLVVADQVALRVGREGRFARPGEAEEERRVARLAHVGRAVHGHDALQRERERGSVRGKGRGEGESVGGARRSCARTGARSAQQQREQQHVPAAGASSS